MGALGLDPGRDQLMKRPPSVRTWLRRLLLVCLLAPVLGACTMVQADPIDRATVGPLSAIRPAIPHPVSPQPTDDAAWHLRLTRL